MREGTEIPVYEVEPHVGVGPVRLGMSRDEVRRIMPGPVDSFRKGPDALYETDGFHNCAFQVFYGGDTPTVEYIELSADAEFSAVYRGMNVFGTEAKDLVAHISRVAEYDATEPEMDYSYIFPELELSLWRPVKPESPEDVEDTPHIERLFPWSPMPVTPESPEGMDGRVFSTIGVGVIGYYRRDDKSNQ